MPAQSVSLFSPAEVDRMRPTDLTLQQQLHLSDRKIQARFESLAFSTDDMALLRQCRPVIAEQAGVIVEEFYELLA